MSDNPHVQYANAKLRHKKQKSQGFHSDAKHAEREMIRISNLHKIKTGKHINDHAEALVAHHEKAKEIKRQYVQHSTDLIHAKKAGDKERMERAAKGKAQAEKDHLAHTGEPAEEKFVEYKRPIKEGKQMKTFKELYEACCSACEKRADIEEVKEPTGGLKDACWKGYTAVGMKMKNGRKVPNCVPANEEVEIDEDDLSVRTLYNKYADRTANAKNTKPVEKAIKKVHGSKVLSHMKKAASANIDTKFDKEKQHFDKARKAAGNTDMIGATVGKNRSAFRKQYEETDKNQKLRDALEKVKNDFTKSHAEGKPTDKKPTPAPKPEPTSVGGGMDYYPKAPYGRRYMGDSVEMNGKKIEETQKGKNVVPPTAGTIGSIGGLVREEENENKPLGKVMRAGDGKKKFKVFVKNAKGNTVKVGFGDPNMEIKRDDPERRKNFRARHNCDTAKDRTTPRYWSCRQWRSSSKVEA